MFLMDHEVTCEHSELAQTIADRQKQGHCIANVYRLPGDPNGFASSKISKYRIQSVTAEDR